MSRRQIDEFEILFWLPFQYSKESLTSDERAELCEATHFAGS